MRQVVRAAQAIGWHVPTDLSVVGIDNEASCADFTPPLTSVDIPGERLGQEAMRAVLRLLTGAPFTECRVEIPVTEIVVRASTGPPPGT